MQVVHLPTRSLFVFIYCPLSLLSVRPSLELVAVKFLFQVWAMVEGPPFHQNTKGQGMAMQIHLWYLELGVEFVKWSAARRSHDCKVAYATALTWLTFQWTMVAGSNQWLMNESDNFILCLLCEFVICSDGLFTEPFYANLNLVFLLFSILLSQHTLHYIFNGFYSSQLLCTYMTSLTASDWGKQEIRCS